MSQQVGVNPGAGVCQQREYLGTCMLTRICVCGGEVLG